MKAAAIGFIIVGAVLVLGFIIGRVLALNDRDVTPDEGGEE